MKWYWYDISKPMTMWSNEEGERNDQPTMKKWQ